MLTDKEKESFRELLQRIELRDLLTLTDTVTNRVVSVETRKEAVEAILLYTASAPQLLRRKKVKREHLYHYLAEKGCVESVTADKQCLCRRILQLWGSRNDELDLRIYDDDDDTNENVPQIRQPSAQPTSTKPNTQATVPSTDGQALAEHFTPWFYNILNSLDDKQASSTASDNAWGSHHFWNDAKCNITMISEQRVQDQCQGSQAVSTKLAEIVSKEKLYFNLNVSGIKGDIDAYGLVRITAGGTVHRLNNCIGIFEQSFGLIRDPQSQNNWKIKFTQLKLKSQGAIQGRDDSNALSGPDTGQVALRS